MRLHNCCGFTKRLHNSNKFTVAQAQPRRVHRTPRAALCVSGRVIPVEGPRLDVLTVRHNLLQPVMRRSLAAPIIPIIPFLTMTSRLFSGQSRQLSITSRPPHQWLRCSRLTWAAIPSRPSSPTWSASLPTSLATSASSRCSAPQRAPARCGRNGDRCPNGDRLRREE